MSEFPTDVVDERGHVHRLERQLGRGGQGVVFRTGDPNTAVKFLVKPPSKAQGRGTVGHSRLYQQMTREAGDDLLKDARARERLRRRLEIVQTLPAPAELNLARPTALLRDYVGYSMQLLDGMEPILNLIARPGLEDVRGFYGQTGSLRRRLRLLSRTCDVLARLHAVPLVYADISPYNVFVPRPLDEDDVWLIDLDNLHFQTPKGPFIYSPGFGAPEVVQGTTGVNTLTDTWSFAVLAWYVLTQTHPLIGDYVDEGGWDEDDDLEEQAYSGQIPWIHDKDDDTNYTELGIFPRKLVATPRLTDLFHQTFGPGRADPLARPSLLQWSDALRRAVDVTVTCSECGQTYFVPHRRCPWCEASPFAECLYLRASRWVPEEADVERERLDHPPVWHKVVDANTRDTIQAQVVRAVSFRDTDPPALEIAVHRRGVELKALDRTPYFIVGSHGTPTPLVDGKRLRLPVSGEEWHLHCGPLDNPHRIVSFLYVQGEDA